MLPLCDICVGGIGNGTGCPMLPDTIVPATSIAANSVTRIAIFMIFLSSNFCFFRNMSKSCQ